MTEVTAPTLADPYELISVQAVTAPEGATGVLWYRYEIAQGVNRIVGYRQGACESVTVAVQAIVLQLNSRRQQQRGRVHLTPPSSLRAARG